MKYQVYFGIAIRIIILFAVGFIWSYSNPALQDFLGDTPCPLGICGGEFGDKHIEWKPAHYWYSWCMFFLFILSLINAIIGSVNLITKHYSDI